MIFIWLTLIVELLVLSLFSSFYGGTLEIGMLIVSLHSFLTIVIILGFQTKFKILFLVSYILRIMVLFFDIFGRNIFVLPSSGSDSEMYYKNAVLISENMEMLGNTRGGTYSDLMGIIYYFIGPDRLIGQYLNVVIGLSTVFIIYRILKYLNINKTTSFYIVLIAGIFPNSVIMSGIFLREIIPTFLVSLSLLSFLKWFKNGDFQKVLLSFVLLGLACTFHAGLVGIAFGYTFAFLFYNRRENKFKFELKTVFMFVVMNLIFILAFTVFNDILFRKFSSVENVEDIISVADPYRAGGAAYLTSIEINNIFDFVVYSPLKSFYFLFSPLPLDWRGLGDIFIFLTDSCLYLYTVILVFKRWKYLDLEKPLVWTLILMIIGIVFVFGVGVSNAGTAMRHRQKVIAIFMCLLSILENQRKMIEDKK